VAVNDFDLRDVAVLPDKADAPLIVDPDTVLPARSPLSASSRLPGKTLRSDSAAAALSMRSLRRATFAMLPNRFECRSL
jgi:hypothetical protein